MKFIILFGIFVVLFTGSLASSVPVPVQPCEEDGDIPIPVSFTSEGCVQPPCPLVKGTTANANITFKIPDDTNISMVDIKAKVAGFWVPFSPKDSNVCHSLLNSYCPLDKNEVVIYNMAIPVLSVYPALSLTLKVKILDEREQTIMCMKVACKVVKPPKLT